MTSYVHGYSEREQERLHDQAGTLNELLHHDTRYPAGAQVLEAGCGVGAQTVLLAANSPEAQFTCLDISETSLIQARALAASRGLTNVRFLCGDLYSLPFVENNPQEWAGFNHVFLCFVLEHVAQPEMLLASLSGVLKDGGTLTAIEGDHGSCFFHPETRAARAAWQCLIDAQAGLGGDSLVGRRLFPLLDGSGLAAVQVTRRDVYCDASRPQWMDGFVKKTIIPMVEGVKQTALAQGMIDESTWAQGIRDLHLTGKAPGGTFCYTFFKGVGTKQGST